MTLLVAFLLWCLLLVMCWPVAVLALVVFPLLWLVSLPVRLLWMLVASLFALLKALLLLPARLLGYRAA